MKSYLIILCLLVALAIQAQKTNYNPIILESSDTLQTGVPILAVGKVIHSDSIVAPVSVSLNIQPAVVYTNTNVHKAGVPKVVMIVLEDLKKHTSNSYSEVNYFTNSTGDSLQSGVPLRITGKKYRPKQSQIVITKDAYINNKNPAGFSVFGKLQGLKHGLIFAMLHDSKGNLWFATGSGVSKYDGKYFTYFTEVEGLSNNQVFSILEDRSGNIWFGTNGGGVIKYDGKYFTHFTESEGLSNNQVFSILEDRSGNLWFGTNGGGVIKYDGKHFTHFTESEGLSNNQVFSILEDRSGNLWFGTNGGGVSKFDGQSFTHFTESEGLSSNIVKSILADKNGNLWFGTDRGVSKYDGQSFTHFTEKEGLSNNKVLSMLEDNNGCIWFGTNGGGVSKYDGQSFTHFTESEGLSNNIVKSILADKTGNLWLGTYSGVSKYDGKSFTHFTESEGLSNNMILSMLTDKSGNIWFGSFSGVSKYDGKSFTHFTEAEGLSNNMVFSMLEDSSGNLWFGTNGGGVSKYDGKSFTHFTEAEGLSGNIVKSILADKTGSLWFGTNGGGVSKYDGKYFTHFTESEGLSNNTVLSMLEDKNGNLWFGTNGGGVIKYDGKYFTHFTESEGLSNNIVRSILEDKSGNLWFGTNGGGVSKYDPSNSLITGLKMFTNYTEEDGLSNNFVFSMLEDSSGNIWFGTRFGISIMEEDKIDEIPNQVQNDGKVLFKKYGYHDGIYGIGINIGKTMMQGKDGMIWLGTNDRLTIVNPSTELFGVHDAPKVEVNAINLFNEELVWINLENKQDSIIALQNGVNIVDFEFDGITKWNNLPKNLSLAYNNNSLTFKFRGTTMYQPQKVSYQYKLDGLDKNWSGISLKDEAIFSNLLHGVYTFRVKSINSNGNWSEQVSYSFTIRPPWWKTWWAYFIYVSFFGTSLWFIFQIQTKRLKERQKELETEIEIATVEIRNEKSKVENVLVEVEAKNIEIEKAHKKLAEHHKEITDSIEYAERIQRSFLATKQQLDDNLTDYFIFFQPKDVVSGDFYLAVTLANGIFAIVNGDSTGHGVPGAIMSILNITSIEKAVDVGLTAPAEIFNYTRKTIIERLKKDGSEHGGKDGMDGSIICFNTTKTKMTYAAAQNPIWVIRSGEVIVIKAEKMPVGKHDHDHIPFIGGEFDLQKGDQVYTITDGFQDQFGGPKGKKFMLKKMREYVLSISHLSMQEQYQKIDETFSKWKGDLEQIDDVCVIGVRI